MENRGSVAQLLEPVREAAKRGELRDAHSMLQDVEALYPLDEDVWSLKAAIANSDAEAASYLARVVELNPRNERALRDLAMMRLGASSRMHTAVNAAHPAEYKCPLCHHAHTCQFDSCGSCGAITDTRRVLEMVNNAGADAEIIRAAIAHRERKPSAESLAGAAAGALNLRELPAAYDLARRAVELDPNHAGAMLLARRLEDPWWIVAVSPAPAVRLALLRSLEPFAGFVRVAAGREEAIAAIGELRPRAVVIDAKTGGGGLALCQPVRSLLGVDVPLVLLGAGVMEKLRARSAGAVSHVAVPFDASSLIAALKPVVGLE